MTRDDQAMDDEQFDRVLREAARAYNAPPPAPVEAMWAAIEAKRTGRAAPAAPVAPPLEAATVRGSHPRAWRLRAWRAGALVAAALLLLSVGIAIGRRWGAGGADVPRQVANDVRAPRAASPDTRVGEVLTPGGPSAGAGAVAPAPARDESAPGARQPPHQRMVARSGAGDHAPATANATPGPSYDAVPYGAATAQHLAQAEVLLTTFRAATPGEGDAVAEAAWARDLLSTTRLLLDSPAARDPERRRLLEDLELVLVQLARLDGGNSAEERALIDRTMRRADMLTKLRAAGSLQGT